MGGGSKMNKLAISIIRPSFRGKNLELSFRRLFFIGVLALSFILYSFCFILAAEAAAQGFNVASEYTLSGADISNGDIIVSDPAKGLVKSFTAFDKNIFGVVEDIPLIVLREASPSANRPVIRLGDTDVNVSDINGSVKKGDLVTSSLISGKGMKADQPGFILGVALTDATFGNQTTTLNNKTYKLGTVKTALRIGYSDSVVGGKANLDKFSAAILTNIADPDKFLRTLRLLLATLIAIIFFVVGFFTIGRSFSKAIESIGRNPLAKRAIYTSVGIQVTLTVLAGIAAIVAIYIVLKV